MPSTPTDAAREELAFLNAWLASASTVPEIFQELRPSSDTPLGRFQELVDAILRAGLTEGAEIARRCERLMPQLTQRWTRLILLTFWSYYSTRVGRVTEAQSLLKRAEALSQQSDPYPIRTLTLRTEAQIQEALGNERTYIAVYKQLTEECPLDHPRRSDFAINYALSICKTGSLKPMEALLSSPGARPLLPGQRSMLDLARFVDAAERGALKETEPMLTALEGFTWAHRGQNEAFQFHLALLRLQQSRLEPPPDPIDACVIRAIHALSQSETEQALRWARKAEEANRNERLPHEISWTLACAELASGYPQAARKLLERMEAGSDRFLLDLLRARLAWAEGQKDDAARHFARALDFYGGDPNCHRGLKGHLVKYFTGHPGAAQLRGRIGPGASNQEMQQLIEDAAKGLPLAA